MNPNLTPFQRLQFLIVTLSIVLGSSSHAMDDKFKDELNARLTKSPNRPTSTAHARSSQTHSQVGREPITRAGGPQHKNDERKSGGRIFEEVQSKVEHSGVLVPKTTKEEDFYNEGMQHYENGNYLEAKNLFTQAGKKHIGAMYLLGLMHETPGLKGVQHSDGMAAECYILVWGSYSYCSEEIWNEWQDYIMDAGYRLANIFLFGRWGGQYRGRESIEIYDSLAKKGSRDGMYMHGWLLLTGGPRDYSHLLKLDIDLPHAVHWLTAAAEKDHVPAMLALADLYETGRYVNGAWRYLDHTVVRKWRQKAADLGDAESFNRLHADDYETRGQTDGTPSSVKMVVQKKSETPKKDAGSSLKSSSIPLSGQRENFQIREAMIDECITQCILLKSPKLTNGELTAACMALYPLYDRRRDFNLGKGLQDKLCDSVCNVWWFSPSSREINEINSKGSRFRHDLVDVSIEPVGTHWFELVNKIKADILESMDMYASFYGKPHPRRDEFLKK